MPLYEYECRACHHRFEALVRGSDLPTCPNCRAQDLERILSMFAVSSDATRQAALSSGRKEMKRANRDKVIADHEAAHHSHDH